MSYNKEDLEHKALVAIKKHNILYIKEVVKYLPCSRSTFYNLKLDQSTLLNDFLFRSKKKSGGRGTRKIVEERRKYFVGNRNFPEKFKND